MKRNARPRSNQELDSVLLQMKPEDYGTACQMGILYWQEGKYDAAIRLYRRSLELFPQPETYFNLAVCLDDAGRSEEAVDALKEYLRCCTVLEYLENAVEMLKENGKMHLVEKALADRSVLPDRCKQLGSRTSLWLQRFVGRKADPEKLAGWLDFGDEHRVIFSYPLSPGVYARTFPAQESYADCRCSIFLFMATKDLKVTTISYSVIYISPDGAGSDLLLEAKGRDRELIESWIADVTTLSPRVENPNPRPRTPRLRKKV